MTSHTSHTSPSNAKLTSKIPHLSSEVQQYKLLKSQGILGSLPTEQSSEFSDSITPISVKSQEDDRWSPSRKNPQLKVHAKHLDKIVQSTSSKTTLNTNSTSQASTYSGGSGSPPWVKETLAHYLTNFTKNLVSPDSSPLSRGSSDRLVKAVKIKSPSISSSQSNPVDVADSVTLQKTKEREVKSAQVQLTNKPKIALGRQSLASGSNRYLQVKSPTSQSAHNSQPNTERPKSGTSRSGVSLLASVVGTPKTDREVKSTKAQSMKVSKDAESWRAANGKAGDSYDVMNKKARGSEVEKNDNRNAVVSLKEQVDTLKSMLTKYQTENAKLKEGVNNKSAQMALEASLGVKKGYTLKEMVDELKDENSNIKKTLDFLRDENDVLKKALSDVKKYQHEADYYKRLAEFKFKECSVLAEEIICLRTDLDRCNSNLLRVQKTQNAAPESGKERSESPNLLNSSLRKDSSKKIKKGVSWKEELIEKSPANRGMSARYSSKGF